MRAIFQSKFQDRLSICNLAFENSKMIKSGSELYLGFTSLMSRLKTIDDSVYKSIPDIYDELGIEPFTTLSKRMIYSKYDSGIVVGAGSGEECINLIGNNNWHLFDLTDKRMKNVAIGYCDSKVTFNMTGTRDGDTITSVSDKYKKDSKNIPVTKIDNLVVSDVGIISLDVEGSALDVLSGAIQTILFNKPDLLVSIYHNWTEYILAIPLIYDLGYDIIVCRTPNFTPEQPHLELTLYCKPTKVNDQ